MKRMGILALTLFLSIGIVLSQNQEVKGTVTDEMGEAIIGASVSVKGTTTAVFTDPGGNFTILVPSHVHSLRFTCIGYEEVEQTITPNMKVVLKETSTELAEVVVMGMTSVDKRMFTGSADRLSAEYIKLNGLSDASRSLEGRSAGVSVQNVSGTFGTAPRIRVRGATSIYGASKPLWVVDGVILDDVQEIGSDDLISGDASTLISSAIAGLNAEDIETFEVLKDGSATSIYGARAMAGVIVITTRKGRAGVNRINYTGEFTTRLVPGYNNFNIMDSQGQMGVYREMGEKGWLAFADVFRSRESGVYGKMYELMNTPSSVPGQFMLSNTPEDRARYLRAGEYRNTDWFDELFQSSIMQQHSVSISSGTEKSATYASVSALVDPGWYKKSRVNRYTANLNTNYHITKDLSFNIITNGSYRSQQAPGTLASEVDDVYGEIMRDFDINPYSYALSASRTLDPGETYTRNYAPFNISQELDNNYMDIDVVDLKFQAEIKWKVVPQLELSLLGAARYTGTAMHHHIKDKSNQAEAYRAMGDATISANNPYLYLDPDNRYALPITLLPSGGIYQRTDNKRLSYDLRPSAVWKQAFAEKHYFQLFGAMELRSSDANATWFNGWGMQYDMGEIPFYVYEFFKKGIESNSSYYSLSNRRSRDVAFVASGHYSFDHRYSIQGSFRYEGSNKMGLATSARWLPTWNVGAAWNATQEDFIREALPFVSHLKVSTAYSLTGERGPEFVTNSLAILSGTVPYRPFTSLKENALYLEDIENSELTYEKKHELNMRLESSVLKNRLHFVLEWYKRKNYDLIGAISVPGIGGVVNKMANVAEMKGGGFEITVSSRNIVHPDFKWNTDFILGKSTTEVSKLDTRVNVMSLISGNGFTGEGYPGRALFSIPFAGLNEYGIPTVVNEKGEVTSTSVNFQERINKDFLIYEGPTDPIYTGSLQNNFRYKNLSFNLFLTYAFGNVLRLDPYFKASYSDLSAMPKEFKNRWTLPGDEQTTNIPTILSSWQYQENNSYQVGYNAYNYSDVRVAKGDFIRLKEVSLTYDFPSYLLSNHVLVKNLSLKLQATNLFLLYADSKLNGQDPEFYRSGGVAAPLPRQFTLTLRLGI